MNKLKRLEAYIVHMKQMLTKADLTSEKKAWINLEIRRTSIDITNLTGAK